MQKAITREELIEINQRLNKAIIESAAQISLANKPLMPVLWNDCVNYGLRNHWQIIKDFDDNMVNTGIILMVLKPDSSVIKENEIIQDDTFKNTVLNVLESNELLIPNNGQVLLKTGIGPTENEIYARVLILAIVNYAHDLGFAELDGKLAKGYYDALDLRSDEEIKNNDGWMNFSSNPAYAQYAVIKSCLD